jgi:hypothetical protein
MNIILDTSLYKVRLSKKSGLPNSDLPALNENLTIKEVNNLNFAIAIEEKHIIVLPKLKFDDNSDKISVCNKSKNEELFYSFAPTKVKDCKESKEPLLEVEKSDKKGCCFYICSLFKC